MVEQTDAEFIAEVKANFENGEVDDCPHLCVACEYIPAAHLARTAIPRLIAIVEERERERDAAEKRATKLFLERRAFWDELIPLGPRCRDCADCNGRCQDTGHPCDPQEHALEIIANLKTAAARAEKAEREIDQTAAVIGDFMLVPPDGGDLKLHEGAQRMRDEIERLRGVIERDRTKTGQQKGYVVLSEAERERDEARLPSPPESKQEPK